MLGISAQSTTYIASAVTNASGVNPTSDTVQFAFIGPYATVYQAAAYPPTTSTVWYTGSWDPVDTSTAQILVGPNGGTVTLAAGGYQIWLRITAVPEEPVLWVGPLVVS